MKAPVPSNPVYTYRFLDASVPPEFHRSYTIHVSAEKVEHSVDVYGNILSKKEYRIARTAYESFVTALLKLDIKEKTNPVVQAPVGGEVGYLTFVDSLGNEVKGKMYANRPEYNTLEGNITEAVALFKELVPGLAKK